MTRGEVYEYTLGNARVRVVVVSAAPYNPGRATYAVVRSGGPARSAVVAVTTGPADPLRGTVDLTRLRPLIGDNVGARVGRMSRATMTRIDEGLRAYLDL